LGELAREKVGLFVEVEKEIFRYAVSDDEVTPKAGVAEWLGINPKNTFSICL